MIPKLVNGTMSNYDCTLASPIASEEQGENWRDLALAHAVVGEA